MPLPSLAAAAVFTSALVGSILASVRSAVTAGGQSLAPPSEGRHEPVSREHSGTIYSYGGDKRDDWWRCWAPGRRIPASTPRSRPGGDW